MTFTDTVFGENKARSGGAIYVDGTSSVTLNRVTVTSSEATAGDGGFIYATGSTNTMSINVQGTTSISGSKATAGNGGVFYLDGS